MARVVDTILCSSPVSGGGGNMRLPANVRDIHQ